MYELSSRFIEEVAEATHNNDHTFAVQMIAGLAGEQYLETKLAEIAARQRRNGSISDDDYEDRRKYQNFLLHLLHSEISNIDELLLAF